MSKQNQGIPETITRQQYVDMIESLGFDPAALYWLRFDVDGITAEIVAKNLDGKTVVEGDRVGKKFIRIRVVDK